MPLFQRAYTRWQGERTAPGRRFLVIMDEGLRAALRSRWVWILLAATAIHLAIRIGILYFTSRIPGGGGDFLPRFNAAFMADALGFQAQWVLMVLLALVAAGTLARDLQVGALQFYFSKPITRTGYAIGKLLPPFVLGMGVTALPALVLWVAGVAFTPGPQLPDGYGWMPLQLLAAATLACGTASVVAVALSGIVRHARLAAIAWVAVAFLSNPAALLIHEITRATGPYLLGFFFVLDETTRWLLGATGGRDVPTGGAWLVLLAWWAAGLASLWWVLRDPEVAA